MSDFVDGLREQLVDAAERERARRLPRLPPPSPRVALGLAAVAAMALIVVLAASALKPRTENPGPRPAAPTPDGRDLFGGTLRPDVRYRTRAFVPTLAFSVPDDRWYVEDTTQPAMLVLDRRAPRGLPGQYRRPPGWLGFARINEVIEPTARGAASRIQAPAHLYEWLRAHPDLRVGRVRPDTVAGVPAQSFPVAVRFDRPAHGDIRCRRELLRTCTLITPDMSFLDGTRMRVLIVATEPQPLVVIIGGHTARELAAVEQAAAPVLETLRIGVR